ncbi:MAG: zinc-ribbon domain containing protein [Dehalococcoidia bacterium]
MAFQDRDLTCRDCGGSFIFTAGEQEFYQSKGLQNDPVRCPACRANRKLMRPEDREETPHYGVAVSWGGRTPRQLHVANCAQCGLATEVPFVPRGDRPVYCSNCYNDVRSKQEAQAEAEAEALAARLANRTSGPTLEGSDEERESEAAEVTAE